MFAFRTINCTGFEVWYISLPNGLVCLWTKVIQEPEIGQDYEVLWITTFWDRSEYIFTRIWSVTHVSMDLSSDCFIKMHVWSIVIISRPLGRHTHNVRTPFTTSALVGEFLFSFSKLELGEVICPVICTQKHPQITSGKAVRPLRPTEGVGRQWGTMIDEGTVWWVRRCLCYVVPLVSSILSGMWDVEINSDQFVDMSI